MVRNGSKPEDFSLLVAFLLVTFSWGAERSTSSMHPASNPRH